MNHINHEPNPGIDPAVIAAAIQKGRRERSEAFWAMLQSIFARAQDREHAVSESVNDPAALAR